MVPEVRTEIDERHPNEILTIDIMYGVWPATLFAVQADWQSRFPTTDFACRSD